MPNYPSISGGVETPTVTPTQIVTSGEISKTGKVVNATIGVKPTSSGFSNVFTNFPKPTHGVRALGITSGGAIANSWIYIDTTGLVRVYSINSDLNSTLLFTITYITSD